MISRALRLLAALSLLATGAVHLDRYLDAGYNSIPTIGTLFLLNAIAAGLVGFGLLAPIAAVSRARSADLAVAFLATAGALIALASLVALFVSEDGTLFGFHESASGSPAVVAAIAAEIAALVATVPLAALCYGRTLARGPRKGAFGEWGAHSSQGRKRGGDQFA
jgi:hypothetical protein